MQFEPDDALVIVDVQRDFCAGGALAIAEGDKVVPTINRLITQALTADAMVVASRDWHPEAHVSFEARGGPWPAHCVAGSEGAKFHKDLRLPPDCITISKGTDRDRDQYSAFDSTGLGELLRRRGARRVVICGLALDVCVRATALDAVHAGFDVRVLSEATRAVSSAAREEAIEEMTRAGVVVE